MCEKQTDASYDSKRIDGGTVQMWSVVLRLWKVFSVIHRNLDGSYKSFILIQQDDDGVKYSDNTTLLRTKYTLPPFKFINLFSARLPSI